MASNSGPPLAERTDIHKSCKSLETLLSVFNDYCEAAGAVVSLQKKLAKALRETASMKVTGEIAGNALNASATIFDALSDIDSKFAKHVDKEYDGVSVEVKKWFKKLAKEEKAHDERIANANAKIKQAGQLYEKKSKKNARDAGDEHARYISLLSSIGPEVSQEKYNHQLLVTQRHTSTTYSVAASVARVADAEWHRTCEGVRRFAPTIGSLGEWRALCEGGWTGAVPPDLPDPDDMQEQQSPRDLSQRSEERDHSPSQDHDLRLSGKDRLPVSTYRDPQPISQQVASLPPEVTPSMGRNSVAYDEREQDHLTASLSASHPSTDPSPAPSERGHSHPPSSFEPPRPFVDNITGSVRSLSAFPSPPTHFPPPMAQRQVSQTQSSSHSSSASQVSFPAVRRPFERSLLGESDNVEEQPETSPPQSPQSSKPSPEQTFRERPIELDGAEKEIGQTTPLRTPSMIPGAPFMSSPQAERGEYGGSDRRVSDTRPHPMERADSASSGSVVAAVRNRYGYQNSGSTSPPPRDMPRLPMSVNDLATRYRSADEPSSPRMASYRPLPNIDTLQQTRLTDPSYRNRPQQTMEQGVINREEELRLRERELEARTRELEQEKANLMKARSSTSNDGYATPRPGLAPRSSQQPSQHLRPRERSLSFQQSQLQRPEMSASNSSNVPSSSPYSHQSSHLIPPSPSGARKSGASEDHSDQESSHTNHSSRYQSPSPTPSSRSPVSPQKGAQARPPEKPKGWMRRLSMPIVVGNAFLDGKKNSGSNSYISKTGGISSMDSRKNGSTTMLNGVTEEGIMSSGAAGIGAGGGRRSYDSGALGNRSMTNLGLGSRR